MKREEILSVATRCICEYRQEAYGDASTNFETIAEMWAAYLKVRCVSPGADVDINTEDVAAMMCLLKIGRIATGADRADRADSWVDLAGYAALGGELDTSGGVA